ncbi:MAG: hypothetical protein ACE141_15120 [Bryobacteraceae bacterium]
MERVSLPRLPYDRQLYDSALSLGLAVRGDLQFELRAPGPHLVEVFLAVPVDDNHSFVLDSGGKPVDSRHEAAVSTAGGPPRDGMRAVTLLGVFSGPFAIRSTAPRYVVSAIRWTPQKRYEEELVPAWLDRTRQLAADPFFEDLRAGRRDSLEQLYDRLALSSSTAVRREAVVGRARMAYWLAVKYQEPRDIARADALFREALKLAPDDKILREVVSSSCNGRNTKSGRMPYGGYCVEASPVPWTVVSPPAPSGAPEWAVQQRELALRLDAITRWWVERRQQPNGEIGGGWTSDVQILRQWGPQALGLGTRVAATGIRRLVDGLWASGSAGADRPWELLAEALPWLAAVAPEDDSVLARLREADRHAMGEVPDAAGLDSRPAPEPSSFEVAWTMASLARDGQTILARDFEMYTSEVIYPDRVYYPLSPAYIRYLLGGGTPAANRARDFAVSWPASETVFARAVVAATASSLRLRLYSFEPKPSQVQVRVWKLEPGRYEWFSRDTIGTELDHDSLTISRRAQAVTLRLPPAKEVEVTVSRVGP